MLARAPAGIQFNEHAADLDGATVFEAACKMGLEGIVSKRRDFPYRSGRSKGWIKVKNPASPAMLRCRAKARLCGGERELDNIVRNPNVNVSRGKAMRAEPVSLLFEKQRVVMQPGMKRLQEEMLISPNRLEAIGSDAFSKGLLDVPIA